MQIDEEKEKPYEITLTSHIWRDLTHAGYIEKVNTLKTQCRNLLLADVDTIFENEMIEESDAWECKGLKPSVKNTIWMPRTLPFWLEFTNGKIENWCRYMNEMMINALFLGIRVCFLCHREYLPDGEITSDFMYMYLHFALDDFFESHNALSDNAVNSRHILGLKQYYNLNVENESGDMKIVKVIVPCYNDGVRFSSPFDFKMKWNALLKAYDELLTRSYRELREDNPHLTPIFITSKQIMYYADGHPFEYDKASLNTAIKDEKLWGAIGENLWREMSRESSTKNWCRFMSDELISQIYLSINCIKFTHNFCFNQVLQPLEPRVIFETLMNSVPKICCRNFMLIDSAKTPTNVDEEDRIQWSGEWGMQMFFYENFKMIELGFYDYLYSITVDPFETESDDENVEGYRFFPLPGPCMTQSDFIDRNLAFTMASLEVTPGSQRNPNDILRGLPPEVYQAMTRYQTRRA